MGTKRKRLTSKPIKPGRSGKSLVRGSGNESESARSPSVSKLPDGTVCIGDGCVLLRIKPGSDSIDVDLTACDAVGKQAVLTAVGVEGRASVYRTAKVQEQKP